MVKQTKKPQQSLLEQFRESESSASVVFGAIVVIVVGLLLFNFYKAGKSPMTGSGETTDVTTGTQLGKPSLPATHKVAKGESLWKIAEYYYSDGHQWTTIAKANKLTQPYSIDADQELQIPVAETNLEAVVQPTQIQGNSYTTKKGDSLWKIAVAAYGDGYKWTAIWNANKKMIANPGYIAVGMDITLPR